MVNKSDIINNLIIIQNYYNDIGDKGRRIAYTKAIGIIKNIKKTEISKNDLIGISGLGANILSKIEELITTNKIQLVETIKKISLTDKQKALNELQTVWGIGKKKAEFLFSLGIKNIDNLKNHENLLNDAQKLFLKYYLDLISKIPRKDIFIFKIAILYILNQKFGKNSYTLEIAGSYRREKDLSSDMDCLVCTEKFTLSEMIDVLKLKGLIHGVFALKNQKFMGIFGCKNGRKIHLDIQFIKRQEWGSALLYFTGSKEFNIFLRGHAKKLGYTLNEHGLLDKFGETVCDCSEEKNIFDFLGLEFIPPNLR